MKATYLYCLVQSVAPPRLSGIPRGLPYTRRPRLLEIEAGLWLVVTHAPLDRYGPDALERGLKDLEWISRCALGHERVVEAFLGQVNTIPFRLFTLFRDDARAIEHVRARSTKLKLLLSRLAHAQEWGLRVQVDTARSPRVLPVRHSGAASRGKSSGSAFLDRKRQSRRARQMAIVQARRYAGSTYDTLRRLAAEARRRDEPDALASPFLLDAVFLVSSARAERFRAAAEHAATRLGELGCKVVASGPWPPYSFVD